MTLKKYLRPGEAADYLSGKTGTNYTAQSLADLMFHKQITAVIRFKGWEDTEVVTDQLGTVSKRKLYIDGYFTTEYLYNCVEEGYMDLDASMHVWKVWECLRSARSTQPKFGDYANIRPEPFTRIVQLNDPTLFRYEVDISHFNWNAIYIPRSELDTLIVQHSADNPTEPASLDPTEPESAPDDYPSGNIERRNQIKQDLQGMARTIAAHWWSHDTDQTTTGDMADKVFREVAKFAPDGFMPETVEAVRDWIKPLAPEYARKPGRRKTP